MKLNNHGWGLKAEIIYLVILLSCLLVAIFFIHVLYSDLEKSNQKHDVETNNAVDTNPQNSNQEESTQESEEINYDYYYDLEDNLNEATKLYLENQEYKGNDIYFTINSETLINSGYLENLKDQKNNICTGYSSVETSIDDTYTIDSYIKCTDYTTNGY